MKQLSSDKCANLEQTSLEELQTANLCSMKTKAEPKEAICGEIMDACDSNNNSDTRSVKHEIECKTVVAKKLLSVIRKGDYDELLSLLSSKPDLNVFINGQTALHYCLLFGRDVSWCQQLVSNGANPNLSNYDGWHPIHLAAFNGLHESLTYLITINNQTVNDTM